MDKTGSVPLHRTIAAALAELGMPELPCRSTMVLIRDGYCVGQRFVFDGIQAIWMTAEDIVRFYDENGRILKSVQVGTVKHERAA